MASPQPKRIEGLRARHGPGVAASRRFFLLGLRGLACLRSCSLWQRQSGHVRHHKGVYRTCPQVLRFKQMARSGRNIAQDQTGHHNTVSVGSCPKISTVELVAFSVNLASLEEHTVAPATSIRATTTAGQGWVAAILFARQAIPKWPRPFCSADGNYCLTAPK